ncbi:MAG: tail fiber domain-containing protein [Planctomycetota bacterium]
MRRFTLFVFAASTMSVGIGSAHGQALPAPICTRSIEDQANPGSPCLLASSVPTLGMLYPISCDLFVDASTGNVGIGTCQPVASFDIRRGTSAQPLLAISEHTGVGVFFQFHDAVINFGDGNRYASFLDMQADNSGKSILGFNYEGYDNREPNSLYYRNTAIFDGKRDPIVFAEGSSGNVGIGTVTPSERLQVIGNICATGSIGPCSDARFKKDIATIRDPLSTVTKLRGVEFAWRRDEFPDRQFSNQRQVGFVAQEVRDVVPGVVSKGSDGFYSVDYGRLVPILVEAMKAQQAQIDALRVQVAALKERP